MLTPPRRHVRTCSELMVHTDNDRRMVFSRLQETDGTENQGASSGTTGESSKHPTHGQHFQFWSGHLLVVVPLFFGDISDIIDIPVLTACDIRIGISRIDYRAHNIMQKTSPVR